MTDDNKAMLKIAAIPAAALFVKLSGIADGTGWEFLAEVIILIAFFPILVVIFMFIGGMVLQIQDDSRLERQLPDDRPPYRSPDDE